jgi:hypothetical protein
MSGASGASSEILVTCDFLIACAGASRERDVFHVYAFS